MTHVPDVAESLHDFPDLADWLEEAGRVIEHGDFLEAADFAHGLPVVVRGFHGTTHAITQFDATKGNPEGQFGAVLYFTTDPQDGWTNYALESGPDPRAKLAHQEERIADDITEDPEAFGLDADCSEDDIAAEAARRARVQVLGPQPEPRLIDCALRITRPFFLGGPDRWSIPGLEAYDNLMTDLPFPEDDEDEAAIAAWDESQEAVIADQAELLSAAFARAEGLLGLEAGALPVPDALLDDRFDGTAQDLESAIHSDFVYTEHPETGALLSHAIVSAVVQALGFDAIILLHAEARFRSISMNSGTTHIHLFAHTPDTIQVLDTHVGDAPTLALAA